MAKQEFLNGMEPQMIPELTEAAENLREIRRERMDLTKEEVEAANKVLALLHQHKLDSYKDDSLVPPVEVKLVAGKERVRVKLITEDEGESD